MKYSRISVSTSFFFSLIGRSAFAASSTEAFRFLYPSNFNSSSIEVNYLDSINVSWTGSNTSTSNNLNITVPSISCWKTNITNIGTWFTHSPDISTNLTDSSTPTTITSDPPTGSFLVNMSSYEPYGVCQLSLTSQGYTTCGDSCEVTSGSVKVDQKKDKVSVAWSLSNSAPYAKPLGTDTSGAASSGGVVGWGTLISLAVLTIRMM